MPARATLTLWPINSEAMVVGCEDLCSAYSTVVILETFTSHPGSGVSLVSFVYGSNKEVRTEEATYQYEVINSQCLQGALEIGTCKCSNN